MTTRVSWWSVLAAIAVACGESGPRSIEWFSVTYAGDTCTVTYACDLGAPCAQPYSYECGYTMRPGGAADGEPHPFARIGTVCYKRPAGCSTRDCLVETSSCPPPRPASPLPPSAWEVTRSGASCIAQPRPRGGQTYTAQEVPCAAVFPEGTFMVHRDMEGRCAIPDEPCPEGAACQPGEDTDVPCPRPSRGAW